jgi:hypothetical protein
MIRKAVVTGKKRVKRIVHSVALSMLLSLPAAAHTPQQPPHQFYNEGELKLESGEAIKDFAISYVTHGELNEKKSNAILMVTRQETELETWWNRSGRLAVVGSKPRSRHRQLPGEPLREDLPP